ncbi:hypothetical protein [Pseudomarimonas arenosa]|uniref:Uncharacterized protein n=1 Tax=Pseudomarimonas arenosa TaxID=2774145 RepID=A0AAW3ZN71_9GAMM|nr:hypothetical protein [Pseudomarimonas arenosa]MBD8527183.1 hypothetical protein [Pseudomarimonas arenosa]
MPLLKINAELPNSAEVGIAAGSFELALEGVTIPVAELIAQAVQTQIRLQQVLAVERPRHLDAEQIARGKAQGRVALPASVSPIAPDPNEEVRRARAAFARGEFHLVVDGSFYRRLDESVPLSPETQVAFLRLTQLRGG